MDKRLLPFSGRVGLSYFGDSGLILVPYFLSRSLLIPSFSTSALGTFNFLFPIVQSGHHSLQPFFAPEIEYDIDDRSLVLESPWFCDSFEDFSVNYSIIKNQMPKGNASHDSPIDWRNYE